MGYAVGAMPVEAASAGANHLRDRFWFVGHHPSDGRREGWPEHEVRSGRDAAAGASSASLGVADAASERRPRPGTMGESLHPAACGGRQADQSLNARAGTDRALADTDQPLRQLGDEQPAGQFPQQQQDQGARDSGDVAVADCRGCEPYRQPGSLDEIPSRALHAGVSPSQRSANDGIEWVLGADGKARRVKPGVRLLVDGFPARVGLLRGFGNAIDPRPAAQFIAAAEEAMREAA
jgi:DNA (cytosine-5)-methyltransferase 1